MSFNKESVNKLADVIAPQVFEELCTDGRYMDGLMNSMETAIIQVLGRTSPELIGAIGDAIIARIGVVGECHPYAQNNIWKTRYEALYQYVKRTYGEDYIDGAEYGVSQYDYEGVN